MNKFQEACDAYKKALELDPDNENLQNNLRLAEEELRQGAQSSSNTPQFGGAAGVNTADFFNNPIAQMAMQIMSDPNVLNVYVCYNSICRPNIVPNWAVEKSEWKIEKFDICCYVYTELYLEIVRFFKFNFILCSAAFIE